MRGYANVSPTFWIGETGKKLRGNPDAQLLALYLMTSPHSNMIGVFHCPVLYMAHETGMGIEGASKGLASLIEAGFCEYDEASETVFVVKMAEYQIGPKLKADDKRVLGVRKAYQNISQPRMKSSFYAIYSVAYCLEKEEQNEQKSKPLPSPFQAPPKQLTGTESESGTEAGDIPSSSPTLPSCPHDDLIGLYRQHLPNLPQPRKELWTGAKADSMKARWRWVLTATRESGARYAETADEALSWFDKFFERAAQSDFLTGRNGKWRGCDLAWLIKAENFAKVVQGNYANDGEAA